MHLDQPVYKRNSLIRTFAYGSLFGILVTSVYCLPILLNLPWLLSRVVDMRHPTEAWILGFTLWSAVGYLVLVLNTFFLFTSRSEAHLKKYLTITLCAGFIPFI